MSPFIPMEDQIESDIKNGGLTVRRHPDQPITLENGDQVETFSLEQDPSYRMAMYRDPQGNYHSIMTNDQVPVSKDTIDMVVNDGGLAYINPQSMHQVGEDLEIVSDGNRQLALARTMNAYQGARALWPNHGRTTPPAHLSGKPFSPSNGDPIGKTQDSGEPKDGYDYHSISFSEPLDDQQQDMVASTMGDEFSRLGQPMIMSDDSEPGWDERGTTYHYITMADEGPGDGDQERVQEMLREAAGDWEVEVPEVESMRRLMENENAMPNPHQGGKKATLPTLGAVKGGFKGGGTSGKCGQPVQSNGRPCILTRGHGGHHRSV